MAWDAISWIDWAMLALVLVSALVGAARGLVFELLSLAGWVAAWFAAVALGPLLAPHLPVGEPESALNHAVSFACVFLVVLIVWGLSARAVSALIAKTVLRPADRLLGAIFGIARAAVVLLALALLVAYTPLAAAPAWRDSIGAVWLNAVLRGLVPEVAPARDAPASQSV